MDRDGQLLSQGQATWVVEGELALAAIRDDIAALLRPLGDIRARVRLDFNDGHDNYWYVGEFENELRQEVGGYVPTSAVADDAVRVMGRSLSDPAVEPHDFGAYSLIGHRPIKLPRLHGDWLVYLRSDDRVLSCPHLHRGEPLAAPPASLLGKAMAVSDRAGRLSALRILCDGIVASPQKMRETLRDILDLVLSLDGLPPATFDILSLIPERPQIGALILFVARQSEVVVRNAAIGWPALRMAARPTRGLGHGRPGAGRSNVRGNACGSCNRRRGDRHTTSADRGA